MKKSLILFPSGLLLLTLVLLSCQSKTKQLLTKKWDCVQVENLAPLSDKIISSQDSLVAMHMTNALKNLQWNFKNNMEYECSTGGMITAKGSFNFTIDEKSIICTSATGNVAIYDIIELTEYELVLKNLMENVNIVLHFTANSSNN